MGAPSDDRCEDRAIEDQQDHVAADAAALVRRADGLVTEMHAYLTDEAPLQNLGRLG